MQFISNTRHHIKISLVFAIALFLFFPIVTKAQNVFENELKIKLDSLIKEKGPELENENLFPNSSVLSVMTPSGWGGTGTFIFAAIGGVYPVSYTKAPDLIGAYGVAFGNSQKYVSASASINVGRVTEFDNFSFNLVISRELFTGSSISVGGLQLFANSVISDAPASTFFAAYSHAVQSVKGKGGGTSGLSYTIGIGNGRFLLKSPLDIKKGRGKYGTAVFANISYEVLKNINLNAEWSGLNLGFSTGLRPIKGSALTFAVGVSDLTRYSGDKPSLIFSMGYPVSLSKRRVNK